MSQQTKKASQLSAQQRLLRALKEARTKLEAMERSRSEPIAIIGMGCRFPGAENPEAFWQLLRNGVDAVKEILPTRWDVEAYYDPDPDVPGKMYTRSAAMIEQVDHFDPYFFGISPREAMSLDPQQRLLLEVSWEALEYAGQAPDKLVDSRTGVFVGIGQNDYVQLLGEAVAFEALDLYAGTGNGFSYASGRLSYTLGLQGPNMAIDTACSSSLVALHLAVMSLRLKESDLALAGGVHLILSPEGTVMLSKMGALSPDGRCKTFDAAADGYGRGEGCGVVVLKRLSDAEANGDHILAVIRGSAVNHDGPSSGLTVPNTLAQERLIRQALANAKVQPQEISYIEAHGTGTSLGDPLEVQAIGRVFGTKERHESGSLMLGSVKTNIGHLEAAAGMASLIKVILSLQHGEIPPHLHFQEPNPLIAWDNLPIEVPTELTKWLDTGTTLAGISSFGISGTNAHVIVGAYRRMPALPPALADSPTRALQLLTLSAKTEEALNELVARYEKVLSAESEASLANISFTANTGRAHFEHRLALVARTVAEARQKLSAIQAGEQPTGMYKGVEQGNRPQIAFLFTGQGSQYVDMGRQLYETEPVFRQALQRCDELLRPLNVPLLSILYPSLQYPKGTLSPIPKGHALSNPQSPIVNPQSPIVNKQSPIVNKQSPIPKGHAVSNPQSYLREASRVGPINETAYTQPALFALEYALAQVWNSWGIQPDIVMGHSVGEYAAACVAGVFSLEDGLKLIAERGRLMQALPRGGEMAALFADEQQVAKVIRPYSRVLSIAAINGPQNVVISGKRWAVRAALKTLEAQGIKSQQLAVSHAFHSPLMAPMLKRFEQVAQQVTYSEPKIDFVSNVTGELATTAVTTPEYWVNHVSQSVRFADGINTLYGDLNMRFFVEIGPKTTLLGMARRALGPPLVPPNSRGDGRSGQEEKLELWLPSLRVKRDDSEQMLGSLAQLYVYGTPVNWSALYAASREQGEPLQRVVLPTYAFQRKRYWVERTADQSRAVRAARALHPLLGSRLHFASQPQEILFESYLSSESPAYLLDHRVHNTVIVPATVYLEMALAAGMALFGEPCVISDLLIQQALALPLAAKEGGKVVQLILRPITAPDVTPREYSFEIFSRDAAPTGENSGFEEAPESAWTLHTSGQLRLDDQAKRPSEPERDLTALQAFYQERLSVDAYYEELQEAGVYYGPSFQGIIGLWRSSLDENAAFGQIRLPEALLPSASDYQLHPVLLDACLQLLGAAVMGSVGADESGSAAYLPVGLERLRLHDSPLYESPLYESPRNATVWCEVKVHSVSEGDQKNFQANFVLLDESGQVVADLEGLSLRYASREALLEREQRLKSKWLYQVAWTPAPPTIEIEAAKTDTQMTGRWLILADEDGIGHQIASELSEFNVDSVLVTANDLNPFEPQAFKQLLEGVDDLTGVVYLWGLAGSVDGAKAGIGRVNRHCAGLLHLVQGLVDAGLTPQLWVVTRGGQAVDEASNSIDIPIDIEQAPLWGLGRVIAQEHPELQSVQIDLDPTGEGRATEIQALVNEFLGRHQDGEDQIAYRGGVRHLARLVRASELAPSRAALSDSFRVRLSDYGILDNLHLAESTRPEPGVGEIEIQVRASGLNFRDVLTALGMLEEVNRQLGIEKAADLLFGGECAGVITRIGPRGDLAGHAQPLKVGDEVIAAQAVGSLASFVVVNRAWVVPKPKNVTFSEAATLPVTFLTAYYGLHHLAQIKAGDKILIHSAAGGVGQAAVQLAQAAGAEIFATASPGKWAFLESMGIDPSHIMNSRTLAFADEVMKLTNGQGVDLVLNSFTDDFIQKSLQVLARGGRFVEIGKIGIWSAEEVAAERPDVEYFSFDLLEVSTLQPDLIGDLLNQLMAQVAEGELKPLPLKEFAIEQVVDAFRYMQQAKHIGKVVLTIAEESPSQAVNIKAEDSYLITGGLGALGLQVAKWLVAQGARYLVLTGRRGMSSPPQEQAVAALEEAGAQVLVVQADVGNYEDVTRLLNRTQAFAPLRGIIHAAGVLSDGVLQQQSYARFEQVMAPKVQGSWHLHTLTQQMPLDFFVCFSSVASLLGSPGQGNYAAANAFMDGLAHYRRAHALPALSINWGAWADGGMATQTGTRQQARWASLGMSAIAPELGVHILEALLAQEAPQVGVLPINWAKFQQQLPAGIEFPFLKHLIQKGADSFGASPLPSVTSQHSRLVQQLEDTPVTERRSVLFHHLRHQLANVLAFEPSQQISSNKGFTDLGMDSLTAVEFRNSLQSSLGRSLPATLAFDYPTLDALADYLVNVLSPEPAAEAKSAPSAHKISATSNSDDSAIAIIGLGCRFPNLANDSESFWQLLSEGVDAIREVPKERWDVDAYYDPDANASGKISTRYGSFLSDVEQFDPQFFGISPREALALDPQQRLLLEVSWEALEHANQVPSALEGATGVFVGICGNEYGKLLAQAAEADRLEAYLGTGNALSVAAGRLSYTLGLTGPCMAIDTACSSSLVSVHLAMMSLRNGESDLALAGGVNLILTPDASIVFSQAQMLAPDGRCKTFDAKANGYVRGEGCGMVVLKRLPDAIADGDKILAVIRGSAVNQDGRSSGLTVPNGPAQQAVIRQALANGNINPSEVSYIEAHGTGTSLGDPIELGALGTVFAEGREQPLIVGSVKTNIGHLEGAAGIAGLIKVVLSLQHHQIPPHLHFSEPNPYIPWHDLPITVPTQAMDWPSTRKIAGVSSFGFSGTNAHLVLEEAPALPTLVIPPREPYLLTLSAKTEEALKALAARYVTYLAAKPALDFADVCFTANIGRTHFEERLAIVTASSSEAQAKLSAWLAGEQANDLFDHRQLTQLNEQSPISNTQRARCLQSPIPNHQSPVSNLHLLAQQYLRGEPIDWSILHGSLLQSRRLALPTYPFQRERYWVEASTGGNQRESSPNDWLYQVEWEPTERSQEQIELDPSHSWLIVSAETESGLVQALADLLESHQQEVILLDIERDLAQLEHLFETIDNLSHVIWMAHGRHEASLPKEHAIDEALKHCGEVLHLVQSLSKESLTCRLWLVTQGAVSIGDSPLALTQAPLWGLGKVIALEEPQLWGGLIDLGIGDWRVESGDWRLESGDGRVESGDGRLEGGDGRFEIRDSRVAPAGHDKSEEWGVALAKRLLAELSDAENEQQIAFRDGQRYVARLATPARPLAPSLHRPIASDGTYLITGGLGALGLKVAEWLVELGAQHLVLTGRRRPSEAAERRLAALREAAGGVGVISADVANRAQVEALLTEIEEEWPPLRGIIHAAGVLDDGLLRQQSLSRFERVMAPKVQGSWNLHTLTREMALDFFVLFSSTASLFGSPGQASYAAANAFMDALAQQRRLEGLPALSIHWGPWAGSGMAADLDLNQGALTPLTPEQNLLAFGQVLASSESTIGVAKMDWAQLATPLMGIVPSLFFERFIHEQAPVQAESQLLEHLKQAENPRALMMAHVQKEVEHVLGLSNPEPKKGFFDMGMDSLMAVELSNQLGDALGLLLPPTLAFEYATIESLATYLLSASGVYDAPRKRSDESQGVEHGGGTTLAWREKKVGARANEPIAIIGMSCRFPDGANDPDAFWQLLREGRDAVSEIPAERWDVDAFYDPNPKAPNKMYVRHGSFLDQVEQFDPHFFGITPREAITLDPQQRLLLEVSWEALERAGYSPAPVQTGIFIGMAQNDYVQRLAAWAANAPEGEELDVYAGTGNGLSFASGRLSYTLGLQGPNMALDTACSSSLVALHLACQSLRFGECEMALAGGVQLILSPEVTIALSKMKALSPDGRCKTFSAQADGYGRGEGCGMVVLKRLSDAQRDGDQILALIRGSAVNHDGPSSGLTVPNKLAQEALIRQALANGNVEPQEISYIEAHGTGTSLGDPLELRALGGVFGERDMPLWVGAVKSNIGHLEAAAGIASVIKVVLALQHAEIPPHLHFTEPNPNLNWDELPIKVAAERTPWPEGGRVAGISSFGLSGTNAHLILEAPPSSDDARSSSPLNPPRTTEVVTTNHLLTLSAKTEAALHQLAQRYHTHLAAAALSQAPFADICFTSHVGRSHFAHRLAIIATSSNEAQAKLSAWLAGEQANGVLSGKVERNRLEVDTQATPSSAEQAQATGDVYLLAEQYIQGEPIDWLAWYSEESHHRIELPTYPFQRKRYWIESFSNGHQQRQPEEVSSPRKRDANVPAVREWLYEIEWIKQELRELDETTLSVPGGWVILADEGGLGDALAQLLEQHGQQVIVQYASEASLDFEQIGDTLEAPLRGVIHLWSLDTAPANQLTLSSLNQAQKLGPASLLGCVQALTRSNDARSSALVWVVTRGAAFGDSRLETGDRRLETGDRRLETGDRRLETGDSRLETGDRRLETGDRGLETGDSRLGGLRSISELGLAQAPIWGLGKVIALEEPDLWGGLIDLEAGDLRLETREWRLELATKLLAELCDSENEQQIAFREGQRYVARLVRKTRQQSPISNRKSPISNRKSPISIASDGTYLITGGLGALGLKVAEWLVERGALHLVLTGRRSPSEAAESRLALLKKATGGVGVISADVANRAQMEALLAEIEEEWPPLRGIVHAAGVVDATAIREMNSEQLESVMRPKVAGSWLLHELSQQLELSQPLDFFVMFSSIASVWGSAGQAHYAAANQFLDALAHYRHTLGLPALAINWGPWAEGGMADAETQKWLAQRGVKAAQPSEMLSALEYLLATDTVQSTVAQVDWTQFKKLYEARGPRPLLAEIGDWRLESGDSRLESGDSGLEIRDSGLESSSLQSYLSSGPISSLKSRIVNKQSPLLPLQRANLRQQLEAAEEPRTLLTAHLVEQVAQIMGLTTEERELLAPTQGFFEMGMDSLMAVELQERLESTLGESLASTLVFDYPNIEALTDYLSSVIGTPPLSPSPRGRGGRGVRAEGLGMRSNLQSPIAIVGMSCRVPQADDMQAFWQLLHDGVDAISEVPPSRWDVDAYYDPSPTTVGKMYTRFGGFLEGIDFFDPSFFGISPREAISLDPQQRLLLEVSWEALNHAGQIRDTQRAGSKREVVITQTGVFVGITTNDYAHLLAKSGLEPDAYFGTGNVLNTAAGRISYTFGLQGPSMAIDTACSSSLVAIHLACQSLRLGECEQALAGGVNLILSPEGSIALSQARMLAPDGRCKAFDASADGYVRSEGCGMLVLKRLADAQADGDQILALIRGSAVNQDGPSSGLTVPNGPAQQALIRQALQNAKVSPEEVAYVEAHGTGTSLGDPIEMGALGAVFGEREAPLLVGSVKSNLGHLESAAGVAGVIKVILSLMYGQIPPHLHFYEPTPRIKWDQLPIMVPTERMNWPLPLQNWGGLGGGRIAGVSSFGASGTNAHIVLENVALEEADGQAEAFLALPSNPWQRERYWVEEATESQNGHQLAPQTAVMSLLNQGDTSQLAQLLSKKGLSAEKLAFLPELLSLLVSEHQEELLSASLGEWLYEVTWPSEHKAPTENTHQPGSWLLLAGDSMEAVAEELANLLEEQGHTVLLRRGTPRSNDAKSSTPSKTPRVVTTIEELTLEELPLRGVVHLGAPLPKMSDMSEMALSGCSSLLHLVQALAKQEAHQPQLWVVTRGAQSIAKESVLPKGQAVAEEAPLMTEEGVAQAALWGLGKVIAQEYPALWGGLFDLPPLPEAPADEATMLLADILDSEAQASEQIAFREGQRYVARLAALTPTLSQPWEREKSSGAIMRSDRSYLITGGLGALGLLMAQGLVSNGARHLILVGRRGISSESQQEAVRQLEAAGAKVHVAQADVANQNQVAVLFEISQMPPIAGIIHAAGVLDDGILLHQTVERFKKVMAPKVAGAWNLHLASNMLSLDFFVCFSSIASLLGSAGQANYAAANAFMDALAHYRVAHGLPALSINWGPWAEGGMAAQLEREANWSATGLTPIEPEQGSLLFKQLLERGAQVGAFAVDWSRFLRDGKVQPFFSQLDAYIERLADGRAEGASAQLLSQLPLAPPSERFEILKNHVLTEVTNVLRTQSEHFDPQQGFADMGMDSLMALELSSNLGRALGLSLSSTLALEYSTVATLSEYLASKVLPEKESRPEADLPSSTDPVAVEDHQAREELATDIKQSSEDKLAELVDAELEALMSGIWD